MKILVLTSRFPFPLEKGDKLRIYNQMRELARAGHDIVLIALADDTVPDVFLKELNPFCSRVYAFKLTKIAILGSILGNILRGCRLPFQVAYFFNQRLKKRIQQVIGTEKPDHIYCHLVRMSEYVKEVDLPKTLDFMDAFGAGTERRAEISSLFLRPLWHFEARLMLNYEKNIAPQFSNLTIISEQDRDRLPVSATAVTVVGNGVDVDFFSADSVHKNDLEQIKRNLQALESEFGTNGEGVETFKDKLKFVDNELNTEDIKHEYSSDLIKKYDVCFVGNLGYYSNVEAVRFLVNMIVPLLKKQKTDIKILLAGARPTTEIQYLGDENITVLGWLDDIREAYTYSRILVAPLMHGIGQQNKILEAMAMGVPVVSTSRVNNAIGATPETEILVADTEGVFAEQILRLLQDIDLQNLMSKSGRTFVEERYTWQGVTTRLEQLIVKG